MKIARNMGMGRGRGRNRGMCILWLALSVGLAACGEDTTAPTDFSVTDELADLSYSDINASNPLNPGMPPIWHLPPDLALSSAQEAQIRALIEQFRAATRAEHEALGAIVREARAAALAGKSRDEIRAILQQGEPIRQRLAAAEATLRGGIMAVLTPAQKAWLESHRPRGCTPELSEAQKTEISALVAAFQEANRADLAAIEDAFERARDAHRNGASREEVMAILQSVSDEMQRLRAAHVALAAAIDGVLTPEQRASGCRLPARGPRG
jgi:Spy/CpxP family protein refolding chaperone